MGSFCTSKPQTTQTSQTQTYSPNPAIAGAGTQAINMATSAANQPFQTPAAPVAPFNPFQQQAFNQTQALQGGTNPFFQNASANMNTAQAPITQADIAANENPYADQTLADLKKYVFDPQRTQTMGSATQAAGGVGADRLALTSQNLDKTQADALGQAQAGFYGQALSAAQQSKQQALQSAQGWANLGVGQQGAQLQATGALAGAGAQQQAQTQAELMSPYEQTLAQIAYPYQQAQFLSGITGSLSGALGGTTTGQGTQTVTPSQPSLFNQIAGLGVAGLGAYGAFGGFSGVGGGGTTSLPNSPNASMYTGNPIYAGFGPTYAEGGSVNPWDTAQGYAPGGDVEEVDPNDYNRIDDQMARPIEREAPNLGMWPFNRGQADAQGNVTMFPESKDSHDPMTGGPARAVGRWLGINNPASPAAAADMPLPQGPAPAPSPPPNPWAVPPNAGTMPLPGAYTRPLPPAIPSPVPQPSAVAQIPQSPDRSGPYRQPSLVRGNGINSDMKISDFSMPKGDQPYPDATDRDVGQTATRPPWMAFVHGGLKMAQSTKSGIAGLAEGAEAGANHLDVQRKELRSEQQINQKAEELYRHAKSELNKYTRKTPHELATEHQADRRLEQERYQWQPGTGIDPATGQTVSGAYRLPTRQGEAPVFMPGMGITGKGGGNSTALLRNIDGLVASGIAPNKEAAFGLLHQSVNSPAVYVRLVQAQEKILKDDPQWIGKTTEQRHGEAERIIRGMQGAAATAQPQTQPGATAESAIPDPGDGNRVSGTWYVNPTTGKPDRWR